MVGPATLRFTFDAVTQRALLVGGLSLTLEQFGNVKAWTRGGDAHPIDGLEKRMDAERSGLMLWSNVELAEPLFRPMIPPHVSATLTDLGVLSTQQLGLGFGSAEGKGRLLISAGGKGGSVWSLSPPPIAQPKFKTAGAPDIAFAFTIPAYAWAEQLLAEIAKQKGQAPNAMRDEANVQLIKHTGVDLKTLVDGFSGSYFYILDDTGAYVVHQDVNAAAWDGLLKVAKEKFKVTQNTKSVGNITLNHMVIPPVLMTNDPAQEDKGGPKELKALLVMVASMNTHLYWVDEGATRILAEVPQVLMDRDQYGVDTPLADWFKREGLMFDHALLYLVANIDNVPRTNYYAYLKILNALGDVFEQPLDLTEFPSARELGLPNTGIFSLQIDYANQHLGAGLTYESHPVEMFYGAGGAMGGVAVVGILAAIAIPAYQDYITLAKVSGAIAETTPLKQQLERYLLENGSLPDEAAASHFQLQSEVLGAVYFDATVGGIVVEFRPSEMSGRDAALYLTPQLNEQGAVLGWRCTPADGLSHGVSRLSPGEAAQYLFAGVTGFALSKLARLLILGHSFADLIWNRHWA